jgi:2-dehydropantoate 2-reductase
MRLLIVGAGAIGSYVGGYLAQAGQRVTFLARPATAAQLKAHGLKISSPRQGTAFSVHRFETAGSATEAFAQGGYDCVVLAVKSFDTAGVLAELRAATPAPPPVLCLQNGVDNEAEIEAALGPGRVIAGTVVTPLSKAAEGAIVVEKPRGIGLALAHPLSAPLMAALTGAGIRAQGYATAGPMKWTKLFTNLMGSATSAILDLPVAEIYADPRLYAVERAVMGECARVMQALGYPFVNLPGARVPLLAWVATRWPAALAQPLLARVVAGGRGTKMPSLHIDLHSGRPRSEVTWLHGAVARHGARVNVPAPVNRVLSETLAALHGGTLNRDDFRRQPEALLRRLAQA